VGARSSSGSSISQGDVRKFLSALYRAKRVRAGMVGGNSTSSGKCASVSRALNSSCLRLARMDGGGATVSLLLRERGLRAFHLLCLLVHLYLLRDMKVQCRFHMRLPFQRRLLPHFRRHFRRSR
jgi:hypothetical protein